MTAASTNRFLLPVILLALAFTVWQAVLAWHSPVFPGDEGIRLNRAERPVQRIGNRVWLPYLQIHIWLLYQLRAPYLAFRAIPLLYHFLALTFLGLLSARLLGGTSPARLFSLVLLVFFGAQDLVTRFGHGLMQEIIAMAFFYFLLLAGALEIRPSRLLLAVASIAMVVREAFWIYLFVFTALNWKTIVRERRAALLVWAVPLVWMLVVIPAGYLAFDGRLPKFPLEWPLMINKDSGRIISNPAEAGLWTAIISSRAHVLAAGILAALAVIGRGGGSGPAAEFTRRFAPFSLLSLAVVYSLIAVFNPWEVTPGDRRMLAPFLEQAFVWAIVVFARAQSLPRVRKTAALGFLCAGLVFSISLHPPVMNFTQSKDVKREYARISSVIYGGGRPSPKVCVLQMSIWRTIGDLAAPTLYADATYLNLDSSPLPSDCDFVFYPEGRQVALGPDYARAGSYTIRSFTYALSRKTAGK